MILTIDVGTTFLKVAVIDFHGSLEFFEKRAVHDPELWLKNLKDITRSINKTLTTQISAISVSGMGPTFIPINNSGESLRTLMWTEHETESIELEMENALGYSVPGNFYLSKAYTYKRLHPEEYQQVEHFLSCPEYICYEITGNCYTVLPDEGFRPFYWSEDQLDQLRLDREKFPSFISPYQVYGCVNDKGILSDIKEGLPVICGGPDFLMALLGTGSIYDGVLCDRTGTSEGLNFCSSIKLNIGGFRTLPHINPGLYTVSGLIPNSGEYVLNGQLEMIGERYRDIIQKMLDCNLSVKEIRIIGGHAGIDALNRLKASYFDIPLKIYPDGSDLVGNAILAAVVTKTYNTLEEACEKMVRVKLCLNI